MSDNKFVFTLIGLLVAVFAICNCSASKYINEGFINVPLGNHKTRMFHPELTKSIHQTRGTYHTTPPPRFHSGLDGMIKYNLPHQGKLAAPYHPIELAGMAQENYTHENYAVCAMCGKAECDCNDNTVTTHVGEPANEDDHSLLPVGTMDAPGGGQHIVYDRHYYAPKRSRNYSNACSFRGDVPIQPVNSGWFNVSANPARDLHRGALHAMGGFDHEQDDKMKALIGQTTTGAVHGGEYVPNTHTPVVGGQSGDLMVRSYP